MTEAEWQVCKDAQTMQNCLREEFGSLRRKNSRRKLRLFGCACCRDQWEVMTDPRSRAAVEFVEKLADGQVDTAGINKIAIQAQQVLADMQFDPAYRHCLTDTFHTRCAPLRAAQVASFLPQQQVDWCSAADHALRMHVYEYGEKKHQWLARLRVLADSLRDIFGNPFRPVTFAKSWRTEHTIGLAARMYEDRDFAAVPILADALEEAGCDNADILTHCREPGVHVRGCWVVDLVLGKA
jgi:hypothetical protein